MCIYWQINYTSCEGYNRITFVKTKDDVGEDYVREKFPLGGFGDDPAEINSISVCEDTPYIFNDFSEKED